MIVQATERGVLERLGLDRINNSGACGASWIDNPTGGELASLNPSTGEEIARVLMASEADYEVVMAEACDTFNRWRLCPAPKRGEIVREIGDDLRLHKDDLGALVSLEMGKILAEGQGEVQEMIDIADFAVGLSRQLYGLTMHSERPGHRMYEQWHPLGVVGVITAFNFPVAVWSWNAMIAAVCGDCVLWKPSSETPLTAIAVQKICNRVLQRTRLGRRLQPRDRARLHHRRAHARRPPHPAGQRHRLHRRWAATSPKSSARRLGRTILELGGNNGIIVMDDANLDLALRAVLFGAVGTAGQRCTTTRRLFLHKRGIAPRHHRSADRRLPAGPHRQPARSRHVLMGPLVNRRAVEDMMAGLRPHPRAGRRDPLWRRPGSHRAAASSSPRWCARSRDMPIVQEEIFAPILYLIEFDDARRGHRLAQRRAAGPRLRHLHHQPASPRRRSSATRGSDCGIANVNIGTSGAEIGGAFGGEKETGGGREAGSDSWKAYMRRQTITINWSGELPLAQGIEFDV